MSRWCFLVLFVLGVVGSGPAHADSMLRVGLPTLPQTLDPHLAVTQAEQILARELFVGLTMLDERGNIVPGLAESWTVSADGLSYVFTLRENFVWSDGCALEAGVVVKSIERALDPATRAPFATQFLTIKNAERFRLGTLPAGEKLGLTARNSRTVEVQLAAPSQRFLQLLAQPLAAPVPLHRVSALKQGWAAPDALVGNGAYVVALNAQGYGLAKNPTFFSADTVATDSITFITFDTLSAATNALQKGTLDLALGFTPAPRLTSAPHVGGKGEGRDLYQLLVNVTHAPLDQRELRHALGMLIDRAQIIKTLRLPDAEPAFNLVPNPPYSPYRAPYARLSRADSVVVAEALLLDVDIPALKPIRFVYPEGALHQAIAEAVAQSWRAIGFKVAFSALSERAFEAALLAGDFDVAVAPSWRQAATVDATLFVYGQTAGPWNAGGYRELTFDQFMENADTELAADIYPGYLRQAEGVLIEDQSAWPLVFYPAGLTARPDLNGMIANDAHLHPLRGLSRRMP